MTQLQVLSIDEQAIAQSKFEQYEYVPWQADSMVSEAGGIYSVQSMTSPSGKAEGRGQKAEGREEIKKKERNLVLSAPPCPIWVLTAPTKSKIWWSSISGGFKPPLIVFSLLPSASCLLPFFLTQNFVSNANDPNTPVSVKADSQTPPGREPIKHTLIGSPKAVKSTIHYLQVIGYADAAAWSPLVPTPNPGEVMSIMSRQILVQ